MKQILLILATFLFTSISCEKEKNECVENVKPDCFCTMQYDPVCGCNNVTYGNACVAQCHGITDYRPGECN